MKRVEIRTSHSALDETAIWGRLDLLTRSGFEVRVVDAERRPSRKIVDAVVYFPSCREALVDRELLGSAPCVVRCDPTEVDIAPGEIDRRPDGDVGIALRAARAVEVPSRATLMQAMRFGLEEGKGHVVPPPVGGAASAASSRRRLSGEPWKLISVARLAWRSGHEYLLAALRKAVDRGLDARLVVVGEGPERVRVLYTIHDLDLVERVELRTPSSPDESIAILRSADVFVDASVGGGAAEACLQAMS